MKINIYDICIIGAGASGLVAAIESSRRGLSCVVVDKNKKPGMKLYATGNGRCNLTNDTWDEESYYDNDFVMSVFESIYKLSGLRQRSFITQYFRGLGISVVNKDGYLYPASQQASSVVWALTDALRSRGVTLVSNHTALKISKLNISDLLDKIESSELSDDILNEQGVYQIITETRTGEEITTENFYSRNIILATGALSQSKLGAAKKEVLDGLLTSIHVPFEDFRSGLCPVICNEDITSLAGVRTKARLRVGIHSEMGEMQITEDGISGILTFNMSHYMKAGSEIVINLLPKVSEDDFATHFLDIKKSFPEKRLDSFVNGYINDKLAIYMIERFYGDPEFKLLLKDVTETGIRGLYQEISEWKLTVKSKAGFDKSQASEGGILTDYIDPYTMQIDRRVTIGNGIYATGEVTDVIGKCGGYNLTYAFITGYLAGNSVE